jgi:hypothetical protein
MSLFLRLNKIPSLVSNVKPTTPIRTIKNAPTKTKQIFQKNSGSHILTDVPSPFEEGQMLDKEALRNEVLAELEKDGITDPKEIELELQKFEEFYIRNTKSLTNSSYHPRCQKNRKEIQTSCQRDEKKSRLLCIPKRTF